MQFDQTKTYVNLARGFAGECQAGMRYQLAARLATRQGYATLADVIRTIAKNETVHARRFFEELSKRGEKLDNIDISAGYPFHGGELSDCLRFAAEDEHSEFANIYPAFAKEAEAEGFKDIAALFKMVANVEKRHEAIFNYLYENFKNGTLFSSDEPVIYICSECGHAVTAKQAWDVCPLCLSSQGYVELRLPSHKEKV